MAALSWKTSRERPWERAGEAMVVRITHGKAESCPHDEPGSRWDYALLAVALAAALPFIAANVVVLLHRRRRYFAAQGGALLILTSSMAGLILISAAFVVNMHFPRKNAFLLKCPLWSFWLQLTFGFWLWLACQALRLLHLHYICHEGSASSHSVKSRMLLWALLLWTPGLVFSIAATVSHASRPQWQGLPCANCKLQLPWNLCAYIILPSIYFTILIILLVYAKKNKDYMMTIEYFNTSEYSFMMALVIFIVYSCVIFTHSRNKVAGRCFLTFCVCCLIFVNFWVRFGWPVYLCLCKSKADMDSFEEELRLCGAECLDRVSSAVGTHQVGRRTSSVQQDGDWILRAIDAAMNEDSECKEKKNQLEQRKALLQSKIKRLEIERSASLTSASAKAP